MPDNEKPATPPANEPPANSGDDGLSADERAQLRGLLSKKSDPPAPPASSSGNGVNIAQEVERILGERDKANQSQKFDERLQKLEQNAGAPRKRKPWYVPFSPFGN